MIVGHGGNIFETAEALGCRPADIIDMSSNINAMGPLPGLMDYLKAHFEEILTLPEVDASTIRTQFSENYHLNAEHVLAGNGTTEFIYTLPQALASRQALILAPTYADYADACAMHGVPYDYLIADERDGFKIETQRIEEELAGHDTVFICNPNNPTGTLISSHALEDLCRRYPAVTFIIDESYLPFAEQPESASMTNAGLPNAIVLNSMSKIFRIPGLRIGFLHAADSNISRLKHYMRPWTVNSVAQAAVRYLMTHSSEVHAFITDSRKYLDAEKAYMLAQLSSNAALKPYASTTSFMLARLAEPLTAPEVLAFLRQDRILIRNCANFAGLSEKFVRISIKTREDNRMLAHKLSQLPLESSNRNDMDEFLNRIALST
jgi:threonine-phosphate decarboxylase